jgi:hypothetical protein
VIQTKKLNPADLRQRTARSILSETSELGDSLLVFADEPILATRLGGPAQPDAERLGDTKECHGGPGAVPRGVPVNRLPFG